MNTLRKNKKQTGITTGIGFYLSTDFLLELLSKMFYGSVKQMVSEMQWSSVIFGIYFLKLDWVKVWVIRRQGSKFWDIWCY
jgi:hypothetical protein